MLCCSADRLCLPARFENPDVLIKRAKELKHKADKLQEKDRKMRAYIDAVLTFMQCGYAMELTKLSDATKIFRMYHDTLKLLQ